jgi:hypothetical protein
MIDFIGFGDAFLFFDRINFSAKIDTAHYKGDNFKQQQLG